MNIEDAIKEMLEILDPTGSSSEAQAFTFTKVDESLEMKPMANHPDVYMLIDSLNDDKILANTSFDYFALLTTGWAAPLDSDGNVDGAPSKHPERRRVSLLITVDADNNNSIVSAIKFADDDNVIFDYGGATGSLAEAVESLFN